MKDYFIRLFAYSRFVSDSINNLLIANPDDKSVKLMAHLLAAEQIWLMRCKGLSTAGVSVWPDWEADSLADRIQSNCNEWTAYLNEVSADDLDKTLHYQNSAGDHFATKVSDMITQVLNHGTHTRAQIGQQLKQGDMKLPVTDYIYYVRNF